MCSVKRLRRSMDRTKVSGTLDVGSIPAGAIDRKISQVSLGRLRDFSVMQDFEFGIRGGARPHYY